MLLVGLTGGIASGKTLVSDHFESLGVPVLDADVLAREVVEPGSKGLNALTKYFSTTILTSKGELNRTALRHIIFANPIEREFLDKTLHPLIRELSDEKIERAREEKHAYLVYALPLLVETDQQRRFDHIVVVDVPRSIQFSRLLERDNSNDVEANAILDAQASRHDRLAIANSVVDNTGSVEQTYKQVKALHHSLLSQSQH